MILHRTQRGNAPLIFVITLSAVIVVFLVTFFSGGCRRTAPATEPSEPEVEASAGKTDFPTETATASIAGKVSWEGDIPSPKKVRVQGDTFCEHHAADNPVFSESLLVNEDKTVRNVIVHISSTNVSKWIYEPASEAIEVDQKGCQYLPHVISVTSGQLVLVRSSDKTTHNVHLKGSATPEENKIQKLGQEDEFRFRRPDFAQFVCDVHSWMSCKVGIFNHPFHRVTGDGGAFDLGKLPPGDYEVTAWHETLGTKTQNVTIGDGEAKEIEFVFSL